MRLDRAYSLISNKLDRGETAVTLKKFSSVLKVESILSQMPNHNITTMNFVKCRLRSEHHVSGFFLVKKVIGLA